MLIRYFLAISIGMLVGLFIYNTGYNAGVNRGVIQERTNAPRQPSFKGFVPKPNDIPYEVFDNSKPTEYKL